VTSQTLKPAVVLVADRTLSADYKILFEGIFATMQTTHVPEAAMKLLVSPKAKTDPAGRAAAVPLGLRRVESAILKNNGLGEADVVCTTPEALPGLLGPWVKIVGFSSSDPLGKGMSNTTTDNFWDGELYTSFWTRRLLNEILEKKNKYHFKVIAGGAGAWQLAKYQDKTANECIDIIYEGYFEGKGTKLISDILSGSPVEKHIVNPETGAEHICPLSGATTLGIVELSRGCGRGCGFCTMAKKPMQHLKTDTILADIEINVANGVKSVVSGSEDFFRYGSKTVKPDFEKLTTLLRQMRKINGLSFMQIDHANISTVMQMSNQELTEIRRLLSWEKPTEYLWVNMGLESANGNLVAANCKGKIAPYQPHEWEDICRSVAEKMSRTGFFSVFSLVLGLPGETADDIQRTSRLVDFLGGHNSVIFPVFYEPMDDSPRFRIENMRLDHLNLYRKCYEINFRMVPRLYWDNQRAGGVPLLKRSLLRVLGKTEIAAWRKMFKKIETDIMSR
jgi:radical SAM superfamily enzyme YgiQ (UPF0313 family)